MYNEETGHSFGLCYLKEMEAEIVGINGYYENYKE